MTGNQNGINPDDLRQRLVKSQDLVKGSVFWIPKKHEKEIQEYKSSLSDRNEEIHKLNKKLKQLEVNFEILNECCRSNTIDVDVLSILVHNRKDNDAGGKADVRLIIDEIKREKPYLFRQSK